MNAILNPTAPLPSALRQYPPRGAGRRSHIGPHELDPGVLRHFNDMLAQIDLGQPALERDQIASAARELLDGPRTVPAPDCIRQRMQLAAAFDLMCRDPDWQAVSYASDTASIVIGYVRTDEALIPNSLPFIGRLDDAILVERAWPSLASEVAQYMDFCRLRRLEAQLRQESRRHFGFTRDDWEEIRQFQASRALQQHENVGYLPPSPTLFRIH